MGTIRAELASADDHRSVVRIHGLESEPVEMWVESDGILSRTLTGWVPILTVLAAAVHTDLHLEGSIDAVAVENARRARGLHSLWFPQRLRDGAITASEETTEEGGTAQVALFSGGADSLYTVQQHLDELRHLLFIHGMDIRLDQEDLFGRVRTALQDAAGDLGLNLVTARTNIRTVMDGRADWLQDYHGATIATVANLHSRLWNKVYIGAAFAPEEQIPNGSHPDLDPLWSTSAVSVVHDGAVDRPTKLASIGTWAVAMKHLRICWLNPDGAYNCGKCAKCTLTMVGLHVAGSLDRCETLPSSLDYGLVWRTIAGRTGELFALANLRHARRMLIRDRRLEAALVLGLVRRRARESPLGPTLGKMKMRADRAIGRSPRPV